MTQRLAIKRLPTGVEGLDEVLGGGIPERSFNLIGGAPGCGKTTLAHQIMFANASPERTALYVTILGEPPLKMLRYQQQFTFFDQRKVGREVRFLHLSVEALEGGLASVLQRMVDEVERTSPSLVLVDSFRSLAAHQGGGAMSLQHFVQRLGVHLATWEATTFLIGEYIEEDEQNRAVLTVADGIISLRQTVERNSVVRRAQIVKMRGQHQVPGLHTFRISDAGLRVYPRIQTRHAPERRDLGLRASTGVAGLDEMMGGGVPRGFTFLVVGPTGSGKSMLATQFILQGIQRGEPGVIAVFEKRPEEYLQSLRQGKRLVELVDANQLRMMYLRPLDLSVEETMEELRTRVLEIGARRIAIDSLSGFELALAPGYRDEFRESVYRMLGALVDLGVTVMLTAENADSLIEMPVRPAGISLLADAVVLQRYLETKGRITRTIAVIKVRGCAHSDQVRSYVIGEDGITIGEPLTGDGPRRSRAGKPGNGSEKQRR